MEPIVLKKLVKKELLHGIWLEIDKLVSNFPTLTRTQFGEEISGNHSWYSGASNAGEDIQLSSLVRVFGQLSDQEKKVTFESIFSEKVLEKGRLLNYLTSAKEDEDYATEIIREFPDIFKEIHNNLLPLRRARRLGKSLEQGFDELSDTIQEMESEING